MASGNAPQTQTPEHIVPLALYLAQQDANTCVTGKCFDTITWNIEHGLGTPKEWGDLEGSAVSENPAVSGR